MVIVEVMMIFIMKKNILEKVLRKLVDKGKKVIYEREKMMKIKLKNMGMVEIENLCQKIIEVKMEILVKRRKGEELMKMQRRMVNIGKNLKKVEVMEMDVKVFGLGEKKKMIEIFIYGMMKILEKKIKGLKRMKKKIVEEERGMGMKGMKRILKVEMKIEMKVIIEGIRI